MKIKKTIYIHFNGRYTDKNDPNGYTAFGFDASNISGYSSAMAAQEVEFEIPYFDPRQLAVDLLKKEKAEKIARTTAECEEIEEKIQQLLALPQDKS